MKEEAEQGEREVEICDGGRGRGREDERKGGGGGGEGEMREENG